MSNLASALWWKAAFWRAFRTMLVIATPYVPTVLYDGNIPVILSAIGFAGVASLVTSLFGIAETADGQVSWYWALAERVIKTTAQALLTLFGTATLFQDVAWTEAPQLVGTAILGSLLIAFMKGMPEAGTAPLAPATVETVQLSADDITKVVSAPVVASVPTSVAADSPTVVVAPDTPVVAEGDTAIDRHDGRDG